MSDGHEASEVASQVGLDLDLEAAGVGAAGQSVDSGCSLSPDCISIYTMATGPL